MAKNTDIRYRNQLLYSVFVRDYGKNGTFKDVEQDLDRIRSLGTDIIWFMPIHPIGKIGRKGSIGSPYAISDYRAVNPDFGTINDFIQLTDEIHRSGMKCIIDVVYNHTSPDSVLSAEHPEWFYRDENGKPEAKVAEWWDIADLDYKNPGLWDYLIKTLCYWAQYVDGFRCDVASFIPLDFWKMARAAVEEVRPAAFWLAESVETGFIQRIRGNGEYCLSDSELYQAFDACYDYDIYNELADYLLGKGPLGKYLDRLNLQECIYPENYVKLHFTENHDRIRTAALVPDFRNRRHLLAFTMFQKGISFLYNGQERSAAAFANIFEKEPIDWTGPDLTDVIDILKEMLKDQLAPHPERADELQKLNEEGKFTPRYYWPNLMAAGFWLGGSVGVHVNEVRKMLPETTKYIDVGYGASETKFNIPTKPETPAGVLSTFTCFYEFIPEEGGEPLFAWELEDQKNYELILTTNAGLYRYRLKDLVHVDGFTGDTPNIYFVTKLTDVANLAQEKIPGSMLAEAISAVCEEEGVGCQIAQVYPDPEGMRYVICLEPDRAPADEKAFAEALDKGLCDKLIQYATYRNKLLNPCGLVLKEEGWGAQLMKKYAKGNATVAQVKVPVVIDKLP